MRGFGKCFSSEIYSKLAAIPFLRVTSRKVPGQTIESDFSPKQRITCYWIRRSPFSLQEEKNDSGEGNAGMQTVWHEPTGPGGFPRGILTRVDSPRLLSFSFLFLYPVALIRPS